MERRCDENRSRSLETVIIYYLSKKTKRKTQPTPGESELGPFFFLKYFGGCRVAESKAGHAEASSSH
jgi:hypothetical protein